MSLGNRIQELRRESGLTIKDVAIMAGVTPSLISQIENDKANPSISTLSAIASALNTDIRSLFDETPSEAESSPVVRSNKRMLMASFQGWERASLSAIDPEKFSVFHMTFTGDVISEDYPELHSSGEKGYEFGYVLSGKIQATIEGKIYILNPGDSISFETSKKHILKNAHTGESTFIWCMIFDR